VARGSAPHRSRMNRHIVTGCVALALLVPACQRGSDDVASGSSSPGSSSAGRSPTDTLGASGSFTLTSTAFAPEGDIPRDHTCDGPDLSPPLSWSGAPQGTRSFALIVDDPDAPDPRAPRTIWAHWVLFDIPTAVTSLPAGVSASDLPGGPRLGLNDWKRPGWSGPCPPVGRHRYFFKLYALDVPTLSLERPDKARLEAAMDGHVLARAVLMGGYQHPR
jgi:Raf kinase inhibitor-like YbhB/YbcL family protein